MGTSPASWPITPPRLRLCRPHFCVSRRTRRATPRSCPTSVPSRTSHPCRRVRRLHCLLDHTPLASLPLHTPAPTLRPWIPRIPKRLCSPRPRSRCPTAGPRTLLDLWTPRPSWRSGADGQTGPAPPLRYCEARSSTRPPSRDGGGSSPSSGGPNPGQSISAIRPET